jgi:hypothetical protein
MSHGIVPVFPATEQTLGEQPHSAAPHSARVGWTCQGAARLYTFDDPEVAACWRNRTGADREDGDGWLVFSRYSFDVWFHVWDSQYWGWVQKFQNWARGRLHASLTGECTMVLEQLAAVVGTSVPTMRRFIYALTHPDEYPGFVWDSLREYLRFEQIRRPHGRRGRRGHLPYTVSVLIEECLHPMHQAELGIVPEADSPLGRLMASWQGQTALALDLPAPLPPKSAGITTHKRTQIESFSDLFSAAPTDPPATNAASLTDPPTPPHESESESESDSESRQSRDSQSTRHGAAPETTAGAALTRDDDDSLQQGREGKDPDGPDPDGPDPLEGVPRHYLKAWWGLYPEDPAAALDCIRRWIRDYYPVVAAIREREGEPIRRKWPYLDTCLRQVLADGDLAPPSYYEQWEEERETERKRRERTASLLTSVRKAVPPPKAAKDPPQHAPEGVPPSLCIPPDLAPRWDQLRAAARTTLPLRCLLAGAVTTLARDGPRLVLSLADAGSHQELAAALSQLQQLVREIDPEYPELSLRLAEKGASR